MFAPNSPPEISVTARSCGSSATRVTSRASSALASVVFAAFFLTTAVAHADTTSTTSTTSTTRTTFTIHEGLDAQHVYVAWPGNCEADGSPLGNVSLALNPEWASRQHEVDYEVIEQGKPYEILPYCLSTTRIHVLPAAEFPSSSRMASADDAAIGHKVGDTFTVLPALDAIDLAKRPAFFASDQQRTLAFHFDEPKTTQWDLVLVNGELAPQQAQTPPPTPSAAPPPAPVKDLGTRWVYAAAIAGLLVGGIIAVRQKKQR